MSLLLMGNQNQMHEPVRDSAQVAVDHRYKRDMITDVKAALDMALNLKQDLDALHPYAAQFVHKLFSY